MRRTCALQTRPPRCRCPLDRSVTRPPDQLGAEGARPLTRATPRETLPNGAFPQVTGGTTSTGPTMPEPEALNVEICPSPCAPAPVDAVRGRGQPDVVRDRPARRGRSSQRPDERGDGGSGRTRRRVVLRPRPQGLPGHSPQHRLEGLVHRRRRRAVRRLRADHRQHRRLDAAVHRHGRVDVHRPADAGPDLHRGGRRDRDGLHGHGDQRGARLPARHHLHHRPGPRHRAHAHPARAHARLVHRRSARCTSTRASMRT